MPPPAQSPSPPRRPRRIVERRHGQMSAWTWASMWASTRVSMRASSWACLRHPSPLCAATRHEGVGRAVAVACPQLPRDELQMMGMVCVAAGASDYPSRRPGEVGHSAGSCASRGSPHAVRAGCRVSACSGRASHPPSRTAMARPHQAPLMRPQAGRGFRAIGRAREAAGWASDSSRARAAAPQPAAASACSRAGSRYLVASIFTAPA